MNGGVSVEHQAITADEAVEQLFRVLDKNKDKKLSDLEFIIGAKQSPSILAILQPNNQELE